MSRVVCFGEALIDFFADVVADPDAPRAFLQHPGGAPANVAVAVATLGGRAEFVGMLAHDLFGDFLLERLQAAGVGTRHVRRTTAARTALAFVALDRDGERSFNFYRPPAADLLFRPEDFDAACFSDAGVFHVCSNSLTERGIAAATLAGMQRARAGGAMVSMDLNLRLALWERDPRPHLEVALFEADIVKLARSEVDYLAQARGEAALFDELFAGQARLVVITDGAAPLRWHTRQGSGELATFAVTARDTTAAGDAFVGGLLHAMNERGVTAATLEDFVANRSALGDALRFAAAVGALAVTRQGAFAAMPTRAEVRALEQRAA